MACQVVRMVISRRCPEEGEIQSHEPGIEGRRNLGHSAFENLSSLLFGKLSTAEVLLTQFNVGVGKFPNFENVVSLVLTSC